MFTGIIEELGEVTALEDWGSGARLVVRGPLVTVDARHGDSIAVNGVCLTVVDVVGGEFTADVIRESLDRSSLGSLRPGSKVNLERAVTPTSRLGGHLVQGHVDVTTTILERRSDANADVVVRLQLPDSVARYVVAKGSITVDGVSLTVSAVGDDWFEVSLIPTTLALTTLGHRGTGEMVNLEVDVVAKYVERLLAASAGRCAPAEAATVERATEPEASR